MNNIKVRFLILIITINLNLFLYNNSHTRNNIETENKEIIAAEFDNISKSELLSKTGNIAANYQQIHEDCFRHVIQRIKTDTIQKANLIFKNNNLFLNLEMGDEQWTTSCNAGITEKSFINVSWIEKYLNLEISGFFASEMKQYQHINDYKLIAAIHDIILNFIDISNIPVYLNLHILYEEQSTDQGNHYRIKVVEIIPKSKNKKLRQTIFRYPDGPYADYYTDAGISLKKLFYKAPVKYGIMSSPFNPERLHPIKRIITPHFGTDYYAFEGDPIFAVQSGIIEKQEYKFNNGNYIKIKHDNKISSQYLHMSEFKPGLGVGKFVHKGEIIGKVGKTGAATDEHVCFRFWHNGRQINHQIFNMKKTSPDIMEMHNFALFKDSMYLRLNNLRNGN